MPLSLLSGINRNAVSQAKPRPFVDVSLNITISSVNNITTNIINNYYVITIKSNSTITFNKSCTGNVLIVGGGGSSGQGGGSGLQGGGGGGGGVGMGTLNFAGGTQYNITIGNGGSMYRNGTGLGGQSTTIIGGSINETATGGSSGSTSIYGGNGSGGNSGSGTGTLTYNTAQNGGTQGSTTAGIAGPGGGGSASSGANILSTATSSTPGGNGGNGILWNINGNYYGGGGGGAGSSSGSVGGTGGSGNGGQGASPTIISGKTSIGCPGVEGTGGGGGGGLTAGSMGYAGEGGSGVVILAFPISNTPIITFNNLLTFNPTSIANCILWLDPNDSSTLTTVDYSTNTTLGTIPGTFVSQWNDKSGSNNNFTQSTYNNQPLMINTTINGMKTMVAYNYSTSSTNRFFTNSSISVGTSYSIFAVCYTGRNGGPLVYGTTSSTTYDLYFGAPSGAFATYAGTGGGWNDTSSTGIPLYGAPPNSKGGVIYLIGVTNGGTNTGLVPYYNGNAQTAKNGSTVSFQGMGIFGLSGSSFNAITGDIIMYNRALSVDERQKVEGYLAWKWGINNSLPGNHPYYNAPPS